jgi:hypothetical protein
MLRLPLAAVASLVCAACASTGTPNERVETSAAAILAAEGGGAGHSADADLYLALARDEFAYAQRLPNPNQIDRVDRLLRRAQVDAELSLALARSEEQKTAARTAIAKVTALNRSGTK